MTLIKKRRIEREKSEIHGGAWIPFTNFHKYPFWRWQNTPFQW